MNLLNRMTDRVTLACLRGEDVQLLFFECSLALYVPKQLFPRSMLSVPED